MDNCVLVQDQKFHSFINREAFADQQEWSLYEHVATEERKTQEEYSFEDDHSGVEEKNHSVLEVTCRAGSSPLRWEERLSFSIFSSSSTWLLLLEWILSDFFDNTLFILYLFHSTQVNPFDSPNLLIIINFQHSTKSSSNHLYSPFNFHHLPLGS